MTDVAQQRADSSTRGKKLSNGKVVSYALGDVANNLSFMMTSMFLMVFMTDIAGLSAGIAGTIYGVTKIWAGVTDLVAGQTVDRFDTRWGRLRPWILFGSLPLAITFVLLFSVPAGLSYGATVAWIFLFDAAFQLAYSFVNIPYGSLSAAMTQDSVDRSRLSGARSVASAITGVALSAVIAPQFQDTTGDQVRLQFTLTTAALGVLAVVLYLICFKNTREVVPRSPGKISIKKTIAMVRQNRPLLILCLGAFFLLSAMFSMNAVGMYYARDVLGNAAWYTFLMAAQTVGTILVASSVPAITVRLGKRMGYVVCAGISIVGFLLIYFVPSGSLPTALVAWFLFGAGSGGTNALMFSMQADTVDYGEWKSGIRSEGGSYSILSFIRKTGQGVGGWAGGALIGAFGYVAAAPVQTEQAVHGIRLASGILPAGLALLALIVMLRYPLGAEEHSNIVLELNERRTEGVVSSRLGVEPEKLRVADPLDDGRTTLMRHPSKDMPVVTLFGTSGSGASDIGPILAEALNVPFIGQAFSSEDLSKVDRRALSSDNVFDRWLRTVSYSATQDATMDAALDNSQNHDLALAGIREVLESVEDGGVVLGRNGALILRRAVGALHVRLVAPKPLRIRRVAERLGLDPAAATEEVATEDRLRSEISRRMYQWDPNQSDESFDVVINTGSVTYQEVVALIVGMYRAKYPMRATKAEDAPEVGSNERPADQD